VIKSTEMVYISGPMTGIDNLNRDNFERIECYLRKAYKCNVWNPATLPEGLSYEDYMRKDIAAVVRADVAVMLDDWEYSPGAIIEHQVAKACGLRIIQEQELFPALPTCKVCGCTDDNACPGGCAWVAPDLCSQCVEV
jgi:hypothetical protein